MSTLTVARNQGKKSIAMTREEVVKIISDAQGDMNMAEFGREIGVSPSYLSDIYRGTRDPGKKILKHFDIHKTRRVIVEYLLYK
jgi:transcriptional regulator with XRE-family HTH domain